MTFLYNFGGQPQAGFSETWYTVASDQDTAVARMAGYLALRRPLLASQWRFVGARLASLIVFGGKVKAKSVYLCPELQPFNGTGADTDAPTTALLIRFTLGTISEPKRRNQQLRGIPDGWWNAGELAISNADRAKVNSWCNGLRAGQIGQLQRVGNDLFTNIVRCCDIRRISERRIGRPFGLLRGSRRRKKVTP
jgi:hypothetical protein